MDTKTVAYQDCDHATGLAVLLVVDDVEVWVPLSMIDGDRPVVDGGPGVVNVNEWFATTQGWDQR